MEKYENILRRVEQVNYKLGISYEKTNGKLYSRMRIINLLGVIYLFCINSIFSISSILVAKHNGIKVVTYVELGFIIGCTVVEIVSVFLSFKKLKITGAVLGLAPLAYFTVIFIRLCIDDSGLGIFGLKKIFFIRHFPSLLLILVASGIMLFIAVRERYRTSRDYKRIVENIYKEYKSESDKKGTEISESDWKKFIKNYSPKSSFRL